MQMKVVAQPCTLKESFDIKRSSTTIHWSHCISIVVALIWSHHHLSILPCRLCLLQCTRCKVHIMEIRFIHWKSTCSTETMIKLLIVPNKIESFALRGTRTILFLVKETPCCCSIHRSSSLYWGLIDLCSESDLLGSTAQGLRVDWPCSRMHYRLRRHRCLLHLLFGSMLSNYWRMI